MCFGIVDIARASTTDGTIDAANRYAWSENAGWIDFGSSAGNVHITDTALTGSAYGENTGWITLDPPTYGGVTNDGEGTLSGYVWSENAGWIDFSKVTIGSDGVFAGDAYGENIGWISFGTGDNKVLTDWRPASTRTVAPAPSGGGGGGGSGGSLFSTAPTFGAPATPPPTTTPTIAALLSQVRILQEKLALLLGQSGISTTKPSFTRNLTRGTSGEDVRELQRFLNTHGFAVAQSGPGSLGNETDYFGPATRSALAAFQAKNGISPASGYFGPITRNFISSHY